MPLSGGPGSRWALLAARAGGRYAPIAASSAPIGLKRARRLRFYAVAASRNSSLAPFGPLRRRRARRRIRLRGANSISTFFRRRQAASYSGVAARARALSRDLATCSNVSAMSCRSGNSLTTRPFDPKRTPQRKCPMFAPSVGVASLARSPRFRVHRPRQEVCAGSKSDLMGASGQTFSRGPNTSSRESDVLGFLTERSRHWAA